MTQHRIDAPAKLVERLRPVQEQINKLQAEINGAIFGAAIALDVPDVWVWDGSGWVEPEASVQATPPASESST